MPNKPNKAIQSRLVKQASRSLIMSSSTPTCFTTCLRNNSAVFSVKHVTGVGTNTAYLVNLSTTTITEDMYFTLGNLEMKSMDIEAHGFPRSKAIEEDQLLVFSPPYLVGTQSKSSYMLVCRRPYPANKNIKRARLSFARGHDVPAMEHHDAP